MKTKITLSAITALTLTTAALFSQVPCSSPASTSILNITTSSANLNWDAANGAMGYVVMYKTATTPDWIYLRTSTTQRILTGLTPGTNYSWKVESVCSMQPFIVSEPCAPLHFTTADLRLATESNKATVAVYPNPVSNSALVSFSSTQSVHSMIELFDVAGRKALTLLDENIAEGEHAVTFDRNGLASGIYFLKLSTDNKSVVKKVIIE